VVSKQARSGNTILDVLGDADLVGPELVAGLVEAEVVQKGVRATLGWLSVRLKTHITAILYPLPPH
jgi:hypothetical protein